MFKLYTTPKLGQRLFLLVPNQLFAKLREAFFNPSVFTVQDFFIDSLRPQFLEFTLCWLLLDHQGLYEAWFRL